MEKYTDEVIKPNFDGAIELLGQKEKDVRRTADTLQLAKSVVLLLRDVMKEARNRKLTCGLINSGGIDRYKLGDIKKGEYEAAWQEGFIFTNYRFDYDNDVMHNKFSESAFRIKDDVLEIVLNFSYEKGGNFKYDDIDMDMLNDILDAYNIEVGLDRKLTHDWTTKGLCILEIHYYRNKVKKEGSEK